MDARAIISGTRPGLEPGPHTRSREEAPDRVRGAGVFVTGRGWWVGNPPYGGGAWNV